MERSVLQVIILISTITFLGMIGIWARRKVKNDEDMAVAGRTSSASSIFWSTFAFWGGNTIISIIELACNLGVVAIWFGIARLMMFTIILLVCTGPFRSVAMVTLSEFIGSKFKSDTLKLITGANIGFNFVFLLVSAIVGAQAFFVTLLGWSTTSAVVFTVLSFLIYTTLAGMYGITYTSKIIAIGQMAALVIAAVWVVNTAGIDNIMNMNKSYFDVLPAKNYNTVLMWIYSFVNNAFLAQAAIQIIMSCKSVEEGKSGIKYILAALCTHHNSFRHCRNRRKSPLPHHKGYSGRSHGGLQYTLAGPFNGGCTGLIFYSAGLGSASGTVGRNMFGQ